MDTRNSEQVYPLIQQWCKAADQHVASQVLHEIALVTGCVPKLDRWDEKHAQAVVVWLQENHPNAYLLAIGQQCVGHPAMVWGKPHPALTAKRSHSSFVR